MRKTDVIIVGGGVIGLMTAWMLARRGVDALVIDSGAPAATDAAAGMLAPSFEKSLHGGGDALGAFSVRSLARWREVAPLLEERSGVDIDFDERGIVCVAFDELEFAVFEKDARDSERLDRDEILKVEPTLSSSVRGGWFAKRDGQVDPRRVRAALRRALARDGAMLRLGRRVVALERSGGRAAGVLLDNGERLSGGNIVVATGARLGGLADLPPGAAFPVKGEALAVERTFAAPRRVVRTANAYLCPKADGRVVIGATEINGDRSLNTDERRLRGLRAAADAAFPALEDAREISRWAGLRPATVDGAPVIGAAPDFPGAYYALGHYRNGILLAPSTADALVALIADGAIDASIAAFSAARFTELGVS